MKRFAVTSIFVALGALASAQDTTLTQVWRIDAESRDWFSTGTALRDIRSAAYDPVADLVTVVSREDYVYGIESFVALDPATGDDVATVPLNHGRVGADTGATLFFVNKHAHAEDGVAYITNLTLDTSLTAFVIYRKASLNDELTTAFEGLSADLSLPEGTTTRIGDTIAVVGSGVNTEIWCGTRNAAGQPYSNIHLIKFTTSDGLTFEPSAWLTIPGTWSLSPTYRGLSVIGSGANAQIWVTDGNYALLRIDPATGEIVDQVDSSVLPAVNDLTQIGVFEAYDQTFVGAGPGAWQAANTRTDWPGYIVKVTVPSNKKTVARTESLRTNMFGNGNGTGSIIFDPVRYNVIFMNTNNSLSAHHLPPSVTAAKDWSLFE